MACVNLVSGSVGIDPVTPVVLAGHSNSNQRVPAPACDVSVLEANWLCVVTASDEINILLTIDALFSSLDFESALQKNFVDRGVVPKSIVVVASHTHLAPSLDPSKPLLGECDISHLERIARIVSDNIILRLNSNFCSKVQCVQYGHSALTGSVYRRKKGVALIKAFPFVHFGCQSLPAQKEPIPRNLRLWLIADVDTMSVNAGVVSWPCHPISRMDQRSVSADFVAVIRDVLREIIGFKVPILFFPGACGDVRPIYRHIRRSLIARHPLQKDFSKATLALQESFDRRIRVAVEEAFGSIRPIAQRSDDVSKAVRFEKMDIPLRLLLTDSSTEAMRAHAINLFGLKLLLFGAEPVKDWAEILGFNENSSDTLFSGYAGHVFGYLPTDLQIMQGGYEVDRFRRSFALKGGYSRNKRIQDVVTKESRNLFTAVTG